MLVEDSGTKYGTVSWVGMKKTEIIADVELVCILLGNKLNITLEFKQNYFHGCLACH